MPPTTEERDRSACDEGSLVAPSLALVRQHLVHGDFSSGQAVALSGPADVIAVSRLMLRMSLFDEARSLLSETGGEVPRRAREVENLMGLVLTNAPMEELVTERKRLGDAGDDWRLLQIDAALALRQGNPAAEAIALEALANRPPDDLFAAAEVHSLLTRIATWATRYDRAASHASAALSYWSLLDDRPGQAATILDLCRLQREQGRFDLALELLVASERMFAAPWDAYARAERRRIRAECLIHLERFDAALRELPLLVESAESLNERYLAGLGHLLTGQAHLLVGDTASAGAALTRAEAWLPDTGTSYSREVHSLLAAALQLELANDEASKADAEAKMVLALDQIGRRGVAADEVRRRMFAARRLASNGRREGAAACLDRALRVAQRARLQAASAEVRGLLSELNIRWRVAGEQGRSVDDRWQGDGYVRRGLLGRGGFGTVYRAFDIERGHEVALKVLSLGTDYDARIRANLLSSALNELHASRQLSHPGVARVLAMGESEEGELYVVSELIEGEPLSQLLGQEQSFARIGPLLRDIVEAIAALHASGIVHCDLKPSNVILKPNDKPVVIDLGVSCLKRKMKSASRGSPGYRSPEQALGKSVTPQSDLYSFAVMAQQLLLNATRIELGERYFARRSQLALLARNLRDRGTPNGLAELLIGCLAYRPQRRPASARLLAEAFGHALGAGDKRPDPPMPPKTDDLPPTDAGHP